jgi:hypothetical protein
MRHPDKMARHAFTGAIQSPPVTDGRPGAAGARQAGGGR